MSLENYLSEINNLIEYIEDSIMNQSISAINHQKKRYMDITNKVPFHLCEGLSYEEIDVSVRNGGGIELEALLSNLKTLKDKLALCKNDKSLIIETKFEDIKNSIIDEIKKANFIVWIAVAWFTDKDIYTNLIEAKNRGVNVQIIMNDDKNNNYHLDFSGKVEVIYAPEYEFKKDNLHNKFCIFDFKKVIQGSFNWTKQAQLNSENVMIVTNREIAETYAHEFIKLKNKYKKQ